jgi:hypothetical protein
VTVARLAWTVGWIGLLAGTAAADGVDLAKIDRTIRKEPAYQTKSPKYGLAVFGPKAEHRVWMVLDGDVLYVDRNADGDLTGAGERLTGNYQPAATPEKSYPFAGFFNYAVTGGLTFPGGDRYGLDTILLTKFKPTFEPDSDDMRSLLALVRKEPDLARVGIEARSPLPSRKVGLRHQAVPYFAPTPTDAPVFWFGGPITFALEYPATKLVRGAKPTDLRLYPGTAGTGREAFVVRDYDDIDAKLQPTVEVEFPAKPGGKPVRKTYSLGRC